MTEGYPNEDAGVEYQSDRPGLGHSYATDYDSEQYPEENGFQGIVTAVIQWIMSYFEKVLNWLKS